MTKLSGLPSLNTVTLLIPRSLMIVRPEDQGNLDSLQDEKSMKDAIERMNGQGNGGGGHVDVAVNTAA